MKSTKQKMKCFVLFIVLGCCIGACSFGATQAEAYTNRKQVKTELKKTKKKMKKLKAAYTSEKKKAKFYKKKSRAYYKGAKPIVLGTIVWRDPLVIYQAGTYYRITNPGSASIWFGKYIGHITLSSGYSVVNGRSCRNATAVKSPYSQKEVKAEVAYKRHRKQYNKLAKKKKELERSLAFALSSNEVSEYVGNVRELKPKNTYYNKIKLTSSNPAVVKVNGTQIQCISEGTARITASYSISEKKTNFNVVVCNKNTFKLNFSSYYLPLGEKVTLQGKNWDPDEDYDNYKWYSSNTSVAKVSYSGKVTAVGEGTAVITAYSKSYVGRCTVLVGKETVDAKFELNQSELNFSQDEVGQQKTIHFSTNIPDLKLKGDDKIIRVEHYEYQPDIDARKMVTGSVTITLLGIGDGKIKYESRRFWADTSVKVSVSELCADWYKGLEFSCWLDEDSKGELCKSFAKYGDPGTPISASGFDSSIVDCSLEEDGDLCLTPHKAGKTNVTIQTSTGYTRTFSIMVYGVNIYDEEGNLIEDDGTITKGYTEDERKEFITVESFLPESVASQAERFKIYSQDYNGVIELGEYVDGKQYYIVKNKGKADITVRCNNEYSNEYRYNYEKTVNIEIKETISDEVLEQEGE